MKTILVYDDEPEILRLYEKVLRDRDFHIVLKESARELLIDLATYHPDLVITDVLMDDVGGIEVIQQTKRYSPQSKILVISGGGVFVKRNLCLELATGLKADAGLTKPVDVDELEALVCSLLGENCVKENRGV